MRDDIPSQWPELEAWLDRALDLPASERRAWLQAECGDPILLGSLLALLDADAELGAGLQARADAAHDSLAQGPAELPEVPGYRILQIIGEGGMASVFLAERLLGDTVQRVALKRLRLNVYDPGERRRFEHEHRILARLEHPNIARLVDAGIAPDGVPWFAMEFVDGQPLLSWCDSQRLGTGARLQLLGEIGAAIHHAHQHLVVHRDLKPPNLMVTTDGMVKVLDFGIAYMLDGEAEGRTGTGLRRLTPGYAAPEQYVGQTSTPTDIYALGVLLLELTSGQRPPASSTPGSDPLRCLSITASDAEARATSPRRLQRFLAGDLGAIARKALRPDPTLRYASAQAFVDDLAALRDGRPVMARRGDWRYRARCFARRNKAWVAAASLVACTLVAASGISLQQAHRARQETQRAQAVQAFVEEMLAPLRAGVAPARMPPLDELVAKGVAELDRSGNRDPAVYSELLVMFARTYDRMGEIETARTMAERAHTHSLAAFGAGDPRTVRALAMRGRMHARFRDPRAHADLQAARAQMREHGIRGVPVSMVLDDQGDLALDQGDTHTAATLFGEAQRERELDLPPGHVDLALGAAKLGEVSDALSDKRGALFHFRKAHRYCAVHGHGHSREAANYLGRSGLLQCQLGQFRAGTRDYQRALDIFDRLDTRDHPERVEILRNSCSALTFLDELERAERDCEQALAMARRLFGADSSQHTSVRNYRLMLLAAQGRLREAHAEAGTMRSLIAASPDTASRRMLYLYLPYSYVLALEGNDTALRDTLLPVVAHPGFDRWTLAPALLARLIFACARAPATACPGDLAERLRSELEEPQYLNSPLNIDPLLSLARLALHQGDWAGALAHLDEIDRIAGLPRGDFRKDHRWLVHARLLRGEAMAAAGDREAAREHWLAAEAALARRYPMDHPWRRILARHLAPIGTVAAVSQ